MATASPTSSPPKPSTSEEEDANDFCSLTSKELSNLENIFLIYDTVGDGKIALGDVGEALRACELNPTEGEVRNITKELELNRMSFEEFVPIYQSLQNREMMSKRWNREKSTYDFTSALRVFDQDLNGKISTAELQHVLSALGEGIPQEDVDVLISEFIDQNGTVDIDDFVKAVMSGQ